MDKYSTFSFFFNECCETKITRVDLAIFSLRTLTMFVSFAIKIKNKNKKIRGKFKSFICKIAEKPQAFLFMQQVTKCTYNFWHTGGVLGMFTTFELPVIRKLFLL